MKKPNNNYNELDAMTDILKSLAAFIANIVAKSREQSFLVLMLVSGICGTIYISHVIRNDMRHDIQVLQTKYDKRVDELMTETRKCAAEKEVLFGRVEQLTDRLEKIVTSKNKNNNRH